MLACVQEGEGTPPCSARGRDSSASAFVLNARRHVLGRWATKKAAAIARDRALLYFGVSDRPLNFEADSRRAGPASPEQLRREAALQQKRKRNASAPDGFIGVTRYRRTDAPSWLINVKKEGVSYRVVGFSSERDAAIAADRLRLHVFGPNADRLNFPDQKLTPASVKKLQAERLRERKARKTSRFVGVTLTGLGHYLPVRWRALIKLQEKHRHLGYWATEREAARAVDRAALHYLGRPINFPTTAAKLLPVNAETLRREARAELKKFMTSRFVGVSWNNRRQCWSSYVKEGSRFCYFKNFTDEEEAAHARDKAAIRLLGKRAKLNFDPKTGKPLHAPASDLADRRARRATR